MAIKHSSSMVFVAVVLVMMITIQADDTNLEFDPCSDAKVQGLDGFTFGLAFSSKDSFFFDQTQLSPSNQRLSLSDKSKSRDDMVAFAGRRYGARSENAQIITSFTLVLEFQKGTLQNLLWKKNGCDACSGDSFVCLINTDCAIQNSKCKGNGGSLDCNIGIQFVFSGTDKNDNVLNSGNEVSNLRQYSLYALCSDLHYSLPSTFKSLF